MNVRKWTMSLRCSLLGHKYGDAEIEREREEQGSEVVVTVREFEECSRCGNRKIITENKEVTALESSPPNSESTATDFESAATDFESAASNSHSSALNTNPAASDSKSGASTETGADATTDGDDGAEIIGSGGSVDSGRSADSSRSVDSGRSGDPSAASDGSPSETAAKSGTSSPGVGTDFEEGQSATDDDGVILDDEESEPSDGRESGEWPEAEATHPEAADESGHAEWPDVGREDKGFDAEPSGEDGSDVDFGGGLTPESAPEVDDEEVEFVNAEGDTLEARDSGSSNSDLSSGISAGAEAPSLSGPADDTQVDAEFVCPECEYREAVAGSSLRAGDICPECARGYLAKE